MAHVIVEIPEDVYRYAKKYNSSSMLTLREEEMGMCMNAIANGTPLPKGHGRLIDVDYILHKMKTTDAQPITYSEHYAWDFAIALFKNSPTVIEADKGEE